VDALAIVEEDPAQRSTPTANQDLVNGLNDMAKKLSQLYRRQRRIRNAAQRAGIRRDAVSF
jgi:hypothetical protein